MKKHLAQTKQFVKNHIPEICIISGAVVLTVTAVKYNQRLAEMQEEADEAKKILTLIWETYLPDPELVNHAAVCTIASHQ